MNPHLLASNIVIGIFLITGMLSLVSGQFILSTNLFGMACLALNIQSSKPKRMRI